MNKNIPQVLSGVLTGNDTTKNLNIAKTFKNMYLIKYTRTFSNKDSHCAFKFKH